VKTLAITLIVGIVLAESAVTITAMSENSAAHDLAAAKSFALGGVGVAGLMSEGERNLRAVLERSTHRSNCRLRCLMRRRQASSTF
jgi:hypothetical protein